jgi:hypothetical protein
MHLADLVDHAGVEKDALGQRRLAGVNVRSNTDVPRSSRAGTCGSANLGFVDAGFSKVSVAITKKLLPAEMCKGAVRLRHLMGVVALLDRVPWPAAASLSSAASASAIGIPRRLSA